MLTRRAILTAAAALSVPVAAREGAGEVRLLEIGQVPPHFSSQLGLDANNWAAWRTGQGEAIARRITEGTAEHLTYYLLQSRQFTAEVPVLPALVARDLDAELPRKRAGDFVESLDRKLDARHGLLCDLYRELTPGWTLERAFRHSMAFLRAKEVDRAPLNELYFRRGLSSDTSPESSRVLNGLGSPRRILLAGPGLDLTRREKFSDSLPLCSHQLDSLRAQFPRAEIDLVDVRPEVVKHLGATRADVTREWLPGRYDLIVATNLLLYFEDRELLTALAGFAQSLAPEGRLLHNDQRFAAKVFGDALKMPVERFVPIALEPRGRVERFDRAVIHRKESGKS